MSGIKILVVEDEIPLLTAITTKMKKSDIETRGVRSVEDAKKTLKEFVPDLIWLDHYLFGQEDGVDLMKYLQNDSKMKNIPVFVVSNTCSNNNYDQYMQLGISKYYVKSSVKLEEIIQEAQKVVATK